MTRAPAAPTPRGRRRLDQALLDLGLVDSRSRAQALIRAGEVSVDGQREDKPGHWVKLNATIQLKSRPAYVGRGGLKLAGALDRLDIAVEGLCCLDVGASTGGFTDCLLQRGAALVYAVDVGRAQLAWSLRQDPRVLSLERQDVRHLGPLPVTPCLAVVDVSFISLRLVLPAVARLLAPGGSVLALVKPQFEAGREQVGRGGIVRSETVHRQVLAQLAAWCQDQGWRMRGACPSPITGGDGNREFFLWLDLAGSEGLDQAPPCWTAVTDPTILCPPDPRFAQPARGTPMSLPTDLKYTAEHEWVRITDGRAVVGITDYAQAQLGDVVYVELPKVGDSLRAGKAFGVVESVKAVSDLYSPLSAKVLEINQALIDSPETVNGDPYGEGWMVALDLDGAEGLDALLDAEAYQALIG